MFTLKIPEMERVRLEVCDNKRYSATLSMKAKKQPNSTMAADMTAMCALLAANSCGDDAILVPAIKYT